MPADRAKRIQKSYEKPVHPSHVEIIQQAAKWNFHDLHDVISHLVKLEGIGLPEDKKKQNVFTAILSNANVNPQNKLALFNQLLFEKDYIACDAYIPLLISPLVDDLLKIAEMRELVFFLSDMHTASAIKDNDKTIVIKKHITQAEQRKIDIARSHAWIEKSQDQILREDKLFSEPQQEAKKDRQATQEILTSSHSQQQITLESNALAATYFAFLLKSSSTQDVMQFATDWINKGNTPDATMAIYQKIKGLLLQNTQYTDYTLYLLKIAKQNILHQKLYPSKEIRDEEKVTRYSEKVKQFLAAKDGTGFFSRLVSTTPEDIYDKIQLGRLVEAKADLERQQEKLNGELQDKLHVMMQRRR